MVFRYQVGIHRNEKRNVLELPILSPKYNQNEYILNNVKSHNVDGLKRKLQENGRNNILCKVYSFNYFFEIFLRMSYLIFKSRC